VTHQSFTFLALMWTAMMVAMMAPVSWRWVALFGQMQGSMVGFAGGYFAAWLLYSVAAAAVQYRLQHAGWRSGTVGLPPSIGALILVGAGLFQFTSIKRACLRHCQNPLTYFLRRWRSGPPSGFRVGFEHGMFCVACCWALMATLLAVGVMSVIWMVVLAAIGTLEQLAPRGDRIGRAFGAVLALWGLVLLVR
jgi:predicted metal-binding membrane protein